MSTQTWQFDLSHSSINFHVRHLMVSKVHGRFTKWDGMLELDPENLANSRVEVTIDAASIETQEPKRDDHLRSPDFFEVEKYPQLTFKGTKIEKKSDDRYALTGDLTIHGVTRSVTLDVEGGDVVKDPWGGVRTGYSAKTAISRKDYGLTWNVALETGGIVVGDKIEITLEIEAISKAATKAA
jgi:polyisoprenoid-binding protein YceI